MNKRRWIITAALVGVAGLAFAALNTGRGFIRSGSLIPSLGAPGSTSVAPGPATIATGFVESPDQSRLSFGAWSSIATDLPPVGLKSVVATGGRLYGLGEVGAIYQSSDSGATWSQVAHVAQPQTLPLDQLVVLPGTDTSPDAFFVTSTVSSYDLYRVSGGHTQRVVLGDPSRPWESGVRRLTVVGDSVYAAAELGVYRTDDRGLTWTQVLSTPNRCFDIVSSGTRVYASCYGIYRGSADQGFALVSNDSGVLYAQLAVSPSNPDVLYASTAGDGLYRSVDGAQSWEKAADFASGDLINASLYGDLEATCAGESGYAWTATLVVDPVHPSVVWLGRDQLYRSDDGGRTFGRASVRVADGAGAAALPRGINSAVFIGSGLLLATSGGAYYAADRHAQLQMGGADICQRLDEKPALQWAPRNAGVNGQRFSEVAIAGDGSVLATLGDATGLYYSQLESLTGWNTIASGSARDISVDSKSGIDRFYAEDCGIGSACRFDSATHWSPQPVAQFGFGGIGFIAPQPGSRDRAWVSVGSSIYGSRDGLSTGTFVGYSPGCAATDGAVSPGDPNIMLVVTSCGAVSRRSDAVSLNSEVAWTGQQLSGAASSYFRVQFDPLHPSRAYVTNSTEPSLYVTADAGASWKAYDAPGDADGLPSRHIRAVASDPNDADVIYIGTEQGEIYVTWGADESGVQQWHLVPTPFAGAPIRRIVSRAVSGGRQLWVFTDGAGVWTVVPNVSTFADVPLGHWAYDFIRRLAAAGITTGCSAVPPRYCPERAVTRDQMAVFLIRAKYGSTYVPAAATGVFDDVPSTYWAGPWIEQLRTSGITTGCSSAPLLYCPENNVTRAQMAVFLLRAKYGSAYAPPPASGQFGDVPTDYWAASWIEQLARDGVTTGCSASPKLYCPEAPVTRDQMAVFLVRAFEL